MTAEEIHGVAMAQAQVLQKFNQPTPQPVQQNRFDMDLQDEEYIQGKDVKRIMQQVAMQGQAGDPVARQLAAQNIWGIIQIQQADAFKRWGPEIGAEASRLPVEHWTLDNLTTIVQIVKSRHVDELARETAERLISEAHPTIRSGTGGSGSGPLTTQRTLNDDNLPKEWVDRAKALGITESTVKEFCDSVGITPEQYLADVEKFGKGAVISG
jgi:hypothetical protein